MNQPPRSPPAPAAPAPPAAVSMQELHSVPGLVLGLSRAARSVVLYDPENEMVRQHLSEYEARVRAVLAAHGELQIVVSPFQLLVDGVVVYQEKDREKSLAFRLFRDGVRRVRLLPDAPWDELLRLLEIIAIRFTGIRQQEEDTVTLVRKAEFRRIQVDCVEGFAPDEEVGDDDDGDLGVERAPRKAPPATWDTPLARLPRPGPVAYMPIPEEFLADLRGEDDAGELEALVVSVSGDLLSEAMRSDWLLPDPDLTAFFDELREALVVDRNLAALRKLVDVVTQSGAADLRDHVLRGLGDARTLDLVLGAVPEGGSDLPPDVLGFLPLLGIEPILDQLEGGVGEARQRLFLDVIQARLPRDVDAMLFRLPRLAPGLAGELAAAIAARAPEYATEIARQLLAREEEALRIAALALLEALPGVGPPRPVFDSLRDESVAVRVRAIEVLGRRGDAATYVQLRALLEPEHATLEEAEAIGRALGQLDASEARTSFAAWLRPKARVLRGLTAEQRRLQWAAVAGTGVLPEPEAEQALADLAEESQGELRRHCLKALVRRRGKRHGAVR